MSIVYKSNPVKTTARYSLTTKEWGLAIFIGILCFIAIFGPHVPQFDSYHDFADQRHFFGIPYTWDVLSNLPFLVIGIWGLWKIKGITVIEGSSTARDMLLLFFYGLLATCVCSSFYHINPDNASVFLDRLGMTVAFAGILAFAVTVCINDRTGKFISYLLLFIGPVCLWLWQETGNLLAWSVIQGGGMVIIIGLPLFSKVSKELRVALFLVIGWYFLSKLCELGDHAIYHWTYGMLSGHSLKHIAAACAGIPLIRFLAESNQSHLFGNQTI